MFLHEVHIFRSDFVPKHIYIYIPDVYFDVENIYVCAQNIYFGIQLIRIRNEPLDMDMYGYRDMDINIVRCGDRDEASTDVVFM